MGAIKQIVKVPGDHEIKIKVPSNIRENEIVEVLIIKKRPNSFNQKIKELKKSIKDEIFLNDLKKISDDFKIVDTQGWE